MERSIAKYQKAFNGLIERLRTNEEILAVMVFGSMVTGDLWDESDIDLFVIANDKSYEIKNIYTEENGVPIHIKLMSKKKFLQLHEEDLRGGFIYRIFSSSRLVFSKDMDITIKYDNDRSYPDIDKERWNMVYLGKLLKQMSVCKKYLSHKNLYTSYSIAVKCADSFAKLYINSYGYMINKDAMTTTMNLNDEYKKYIDNLFFKKGDTTKEINAIIQYMEKEIDQNIKNLVSILLRYMQEKDNFLSSEDIKNDDIFKDYDIEMEDILNKLYDKKIVKRQNRDYKTEDGKVFFKENVYYV